MKRKIKISFSALGQICRPISAREAGIIIALIDTDMETPIKPERAPRREPPNDPRQPPINPPPRKRNPPLEDPPDTPNPAGDPSSRRRPPVGDPPRRKRKIRTRVSATANNDGNALAHSLRSPLISRRNWRETQCRNRFIKRRNLNCPG